MSRCSLAVIKDVQCAELFCGVAAVAKGFRNSSALISRISGHVLIFVWVSYVCTEIAAVSPRWSKSQSVPWLRLDPMF